MLYNTDLRLKIAEMIYASGEGHIPSAYSIVDIIEVLYSKFLRFKSTNPDWEGRDYFILSKGHGCGALYVVLQEHGFFPAKELLKKSKLGGILGGHPDGTKIPGVEASTGSLGHGIGTGLGISLGLKIRKQKNRVIVLIGDGESNEGTVWETALVGANLKLGNMCVIVDNNRSTAQILPMPRMREKWSSFGWEAHEIDGHSPKQLSKILNKMNFHPSGKPKVIIANTIKGKGVSILEGHGVWHSKIPDAQTMKIIREELNS